jgi:hypothetical protein
MPGPWITTSDLLQRVADALGTDVSQLPTRWTDLCADANTSATNDVSQLLMGLGYTQAQIDAWDSVTVYARDLGTFWALTRGGAGGEAYSDKALKSLDRREELRGMTTLMIGGVAVAPPTNASAVGGVSSGDSAAAAALARQYDRQGFGPHAGYVSLSGGGADSI